MTHGLRLIPSPTHLDIVRGDGTVLLRQNAPPDARPFIHPILAPDADGTLTENAPAHHPWQHGLYIGLNGVNGIDFWTEGLHPSPRRDGLFANGTIEDASVAGATARWGVRCDYLSPERETMLAERVRCRLTDLGSTLQLDLAWTLTAAIDLQFAEYSYGGLFIRMPFRSVEQSCALNSEGATELAAIDTRRAKWAAIAMAIPDRRATDAYAGIAMLDHPSNAEHPSPWRLDGEFGLNPARCAAGAWRLTRGESTTSNYRVIAFTGRPNLDAIESAWRDFREGAA